MRVGVEVPGAYGSAGAAAGRWRRLAELQRVDHFVVFVYGLPFVTATQDNKGHEERKERERKKNQSGAVQCFTSLFAKLVTFSKC